MLIGVACGGGELLSLRLESVQQREKRWGIADFCGKGGYVRTTPVSCAGRSGCWKPTTAAGITHRPVFRAINKAGRVWDGGLSPNSAVGCRTRRGCACTRRCRMLRYAEG
jgi:hypothetical protein